MINNVKQLLRNLYSNIICYLIQIIFGNLYTYKTSFFFYLAIRRVTIIYNVHRVHFLKN